MRLRSAGFRSRCRFASRARVQRIVLTLHRAFKMRTGFNGDRLVDDVTFDTRGRGQTHFQSADAAHDTTIDHDIIGNAFTLDRRAFANGQQMGANVAFYLTLDLDVARGFQIAGDQQITGQAGRRRLCLGCACLEFGFWFSGVAGAASSAPACFGPGSLIRLLENILSCLDICHRVHGLPVETDLIVGMGSG